MDSSLLSSRKFKKYICVNKIKNKKLKSKFFILINIYETFFTALYI